MITRISIAKGGLKMTDVFVFIVRIYNIAVTVENRKTESLGREGTWTKSPKYLEAEAERAGPPDARTYVSTL